MNPPTQMIGSLSSNQNTHAVSMPAPRVQLALTASEDRLAIPTFLGSTSCLINNNRVRSYGGELPNLTDLQIARKHLQTS